MHEKEFLRVLTCLCPVRSSHKVSRFGGGPAPCVFCTLDKHACEEGGNYASISNHSMKVQVLQSAFRLPLQLMEANNTTPKEKDISTYVTIFKTLEPDFCEGAQQK